MSALLFKNDLEIISGQRFRNPQISNTLIEARALQPYRLLANSNTKSRQVILQPISCTPISTFPTALLHGNFFLAMIAGMSILSEVLMIAVAGVPFSPAQLHHAFIISTYLSFTILCLMLLTMMGLPFWHKGNPYLPQKPDTLFAVWSYLCASRMTEELEDLARCDAKERNELVMKSGKRYFYGLNSGVDGIKRYAIDEIPKVAV